MPFGAELRDDGAVRFSLWAPGARRVDLCLEAGGDGTPARSQPMVPGGKGWFECVEPQVPAGTRYRYRVDDGLQVPDPASRFQPDGVHGPSEVVDPHAFSWPDGAWRGRPWHEAVVYELHVGAFGPRGDYAGIGDRLDHLVSLGVTAIELMPLAAFPGARGWGYDGVAPFAPCAVYGRPDDLKALVADAHRRGLMVLLDVVYNHFGPEGNYLHAYAAPFFTDRHRTPWGAAIDLDGPDSDTVRAFFVHNALYWLEEFGLDGLRLDAVHALHDGRDPDLLTELAAAVEAGPGAARPVHLVLENDDNAATRLCAKPVGGPPGPGTRTRRDRYRAQWNDDLHHCLHVLLTGETDGYYADYAEEPVARLGRCLAEGFAYQGEPSRHRDGRPRGEPSVHLPPTTFVAFLQNHDQVGNRALGERITALAEPAAVRAARAVLLLAPQVPLLFMGEEFATDRPFAFFCDFGPDLASAVTEGRRREFARFSRFADEAARSVIPDPNDPATFESSRLDWSVLGEEGAQPSHREALAEHRALLALRRRYVLPWLDGAGGGARFEVGDCGVLVVRWSLARGARLTLLAHLAGAPARLDGVALPDVEPFYATRSDLSSCAARGELPPWSVAWHLES